MTRRRRPVEMARLGSGRQAGLKPEEPGLLSRESGKVFGAYSASVTRDTATMLPYLDSVCAPFCAENARTPRVQGRKAGTLPRPRVSLRARFCTCDKICPRTSIRRLLFLLPKLISKLELERSNRAILL